MRAMKIIGTVELIYPSANSNMIFKIKEYSVSNKALTTQIEELEVHIKSINRKHKNNGRKFGRRKLKRK
jgi:chaperonin cofactor prefoldin